MLIELHHYPTHFNKLLPEEGSHFLAKLNYFRSHPK